MSLISENAKLEDDLISVVIPVCNEQQNIEHLAKELAETLDTCADTWEVLLVDDGSTDGTWQKITGISEQNNRIKGIRLSKNFGHQNALLAGLHHVKGDAVITMDGDLQHPPSLLPELVEVWRQGSKIVNTRREYPSSTSFLKKISSRFYYKLFSLLSDVPLSEGASDFRLLDKKVVDSLLTFPETGLFFRGIVQWAGYDTATISYSARDRIGGASKYNWRKMFTFAWTGITSFSTVPLRLGLIIGLLTSLFAFGEMGYAICIRLFTDRAVPGWASAMAFVSFLFGILFILLGIIGEYIGRILIEVKRRPRYLISESSGLKPKNITSRICPPQQIEKEYRH